MCKQTRTAPIAHGFTIIEVMISLSIMAIGISAILSHMMTLKSVREASRDAVILENLVGELVERFSGSRWEVLGTTASKWSLPRPAIATAGAAGPMTDSIIPSDNSLISLGILQKPTGIRDLKIYIDYYRGMTEYDDATGAVIPNKLGLMDGEAAAFNNLSELNAVWRNNAALAAYRLDPTTIPTQQVAEDRPIVIRILLTSSELAQPLVFFTGRKK